MESLIRALERAGTLDLATIFRPSVNGQLAPAAAKSGGERPSPHDQPGQLVHWPTSEPQIPSGLMSIKSISRAPQNSGVPQNSIFELTLTLMIDIHIYTVYP